MKKVLVVICALAVVLVVASAAMAQEPAPAGPRELSLAHGLLGLAAAIAVAFGAIGTAWAQSRIGAAAAGAIAERPEIGGQMLIFLVLPETLIIFGFLVAFFLIGKI